MALWGGRFEGGLSEEAKAYSYTLYDDLRLVHYDLKVNEVHAELLFKKGILTEEEFIAIRACIINLHDEFKTDTASLLGGDEDIHSCIERLITTRCGVAGKKLHTGKSRNDQVATDARLYVKDLIISAKENVKHVIGSLISLAQRYETLVFPGFTHFQVAQPVLFSHHCLAYVSMLERDLARLDFAFTAADVCPLGSAALAGNNYGLDREFARKALGFSKLTTNSMDAVSDRDFMVDTLLAFTQCMVHLSRLSDDLILYSSGVLGFVQLGDDFTTGSSIMPQKKNPDIAELMRGKTAKVSANLSGMIQLLKGLPLTYNRDLQEDKPYVYQSGDILISSLRCMSGMLDSLTLNEETIAEALKKGYGLATELADYLVKKGLPFRQCHEICGQIVQYAISKQKGLEDLSIEEFQSFCTEITSDVCDVLTYDAAVASKMVYGGTAPEQVSKQIKRLKELYK